MSEHAERPRAPDAGESGTPRALRVLLVEDHADSAEVLRLLLTFEGHEVDVSTSVAGTRALEGGSWDVAICDLALPDGSGLEIAAWLRAQPRPPRLLVALSGSGSERDREACRQAGFDAHFVKPVQPDALFEVLRDVR